VVTVRRLDFDDLEPELREALRPKVSRLGYLGEFFAAMGHQPKALLAFHRFTEALKTALPDDLTEVVALTCATLAGNDYERSQHERLSLTLGMSPDWIAAACGEDTGLDERQRSVQALARAAMGDHGHGAASAFAATVDVLGESQAVAALLLVGRYAAHAVVSNTLELRAPVPSVLSEREPGRRPGEDDATAAPPQDRGIWLTEADVVDLVDMPEAIAALEDGLRLEASGQAENMVKTFVGWSGHTLHAVGAAVPGDGAVGTKTWAHTAGGAAPLLVLFDSETGAVRAVIEAFALGQLRTSAISGVATALLARPEADELAIVGTGKQALAQVAAVAAVRPLRQVRVFGRHGGRARDFADRVEAELGLATVVADDVESAVRGAPIVTLVTRATTPFLSAEALDPGTHLNAVGAIVPSRAEFDPALLGRCSVVTVDSVDQTRSLSAEFREHYGEEPEGWADVRPLAELVATGAGRPKDADLTVFKAMGVGLSDLSLGLRCLTRAREAGIGRPIPPRNPVAPRWRAVKPMTRRS
jgi:ornithine cyclodeaminase